MNLSFRKHSIASIHAQMLAGRIRCVDVAQACIDAYQAFEPQTSAWECFDPELLYRAAQALDSAKPDGSAVQTLLGMPVGVKDIFNTVDFPTQMGSPLWKGFTSGNDARAVFNIKRAGALIPGKTGTAEFAVHSLGKTRNPHAIDRTPGTSSSGSAAAVALGMVPAALGTQTAGSIVRPASFCGIYGFKPSFGLIPRTGMLKTTDSLDSVGYFVGHAEDLGRVFDAVRVHGRNFPLSHAALTDVARQAAPTNRPWRVAVLRPHVWRNAPEYAQRAFDDWIAKAERSIGFETVAVDLPHGIDEAHEIHSTIYNRSLAYYFQEEYKKAELVSPIMNSLIAAGQQVTTHAYVDALERQSTMVRAMDAWWSHIDVAVTLSTAGCAPLRDVAESPDSALIWTLAHLPALSAPAFTSPEGLPFGLQIVARRYNDPLLFKFTDQLITKGLLPKHGFDQLPNEVA